MTELTKKVKHLLLARAHTHDVITFAALARLAGMRVPLNLSPILNRLHAEDLEAGRPSLASLVVSAERLVMPPAWNDNWDAKSWTKERLRVYRYYAA